MTTVVSALKLTLLWQGRDPYADLILGAWIAFEDAAVPPVSLESWEVRLSGREKEMFIRFMRSMLKWVPEERRTARQLLEDPWLLKS